ncbi:MAG: hypothetical protein R3D67_04190 [Hyphomicrobiaceae bacterium]
MGRLFVVPFAFLLAALAAVAVLLSLGLERITHVISSSNLEADGIDLAFTAIYGVIGLAGAATIVPALLVVIVGEVARIRSWLFYIAGGGIALAVMPLLAASGSLGSGNITNLGTIWPVFATAGFAGGFLYWLIAGRTA